MKIQPNSFAFPCGSDTTGQGAPGLTVRDYFAAIAMQGLISSIGQHDLLYCSDIAHDAVLYADALIDALNDTQ